MADFTQTRTIVDVNGVFFLITRKDFEDGEYTEDAKRLGNSIQVRRRYADELSQQAQSLAASIDPISRYKKVIGDMKSTDDTVQTAVGEKASTLLLLENKDDLETPGWTIRESEGGAFVQIEFQVNAQNNLRYTVNGGATKTADFFGAVMRLRNYPASPADMDMYRLSNGNYTNSDRSVVIRRPGSTQNATNND